MQGVCTSKGTLGSDFIRQSEMKNTTHTVDGWETSLNNLGSDWKTAEESNILLFTFVRLIYLLPCIKKSLGDVRNAGEPTQRSPSATLFTPQLGPFSLSVRATADDASPFTGSINGGRI